MTNSTSASAAAQRAHTSSDASNSKRRRRTPGATKTSSSRMQAECPECYRWFNSPGDAIRHVKITHLGIRPYICEHPFCGRLFGQATQLKIHTNKHTGAKPYPCERGCKKSFGDPASCNRHEKEVHLNLYTHACTECKTTIKRQHAFRNHLKKEHHIENVDCRTYRVAVCAAGPDAPAKSVTTTLVAEQPVEPVEPRPLSPAELHALEKSFETLVPQISVTSSPLHLPLYEHSAARPFSSPMPSLLLPPAYDYAGHDYSHFYETISGRSSALSQGVTPPLSQSATPPPEYYSPLLAPYPTLPGGGPSFGDTWGDISSQGSPLDFQPLAGCMPWF